MADNWWAMDPAVQADGADKFWAMDPVAKEGSGKPKPMMSASRSLAMGLGDIVSGGAQAAANLLPDGVVNAVNSGAQWLNDKLPITKQLGMTPATPQQVNDQVTQRENDYQAQRAAAGDTGFDVGRAVGNVIPAAALAATGALPAGASVLGSIPAGAIGGAALGVGQPIPNATAENYGAQKAQQVGRDAVVGGITGPVGYTLGRMISPTVAPNVQKLADEGVQMTPGQILGGMTKRVEDAATSIPFVGDAIRGAQRNSIESTNRIAVNRALEPIGESLPKNIPTGHDAVRYAANKVSEAYDNSLSRMVGRLDDTLAAEVSNIEKMAKDGLPPELADRVSKVINTQLLGKFGPSGTMLGKNVQTADSELGRLAANFARDPSADAKDLGRAIGELRTSFQNMLERVNPPDVVAGYKAAKTAFSNLATVQRAAGSTAASDGVFTPNQLEIAVKNSDKSSRKAAYSMGEAKMQDLSNAAKGVLPSSVPDSGTPLRAMLGLGLLGGGGVAINPAVPVAGLAAAGLYTQPVQRMIQGLLTAQRPETVRAIGNALAKSGGITAGPLAAGILSSP